MCTAIRFILVEVLCEINQEIWKIGINSFPGSNSSDVSFYLSMVEITANMCSRPLIMQIKNIKLRKFLEKFISFLESKNSGCAVCLVSITAQDRAIFCLSDH